MAIKLSADAVTGGIQAGIPLVPHPYASLAAQLGTSEEVLVGHLNQLQAQGDIKRFGVVVRHHELGYCANAMLVWEVPASEIDAIGERLAQRPEVTLCYQRRPHPPIWPYNLFCMIHGKERDTVLEKIQALVKTENLSRYRHEVLFSCKRFKQHGARYQAEPQLAKVSYG